MSRYGDLSSDQQRGLVMMALFANAIVTIIAQAGLVIAGTWSLRQAWRARRLGMGGALRAGLCPALKLAVVTNVAHWAFRIWALRIIDAGRGQIWLDRVDRWLSARAAQCKMPPGLSTEQFGSASGGNRVAIVAIGWLARKPRMPHSSRGQRT
jgi:hypothetical protein